MLNRAALKLASFVSASSSVWKQAEERTHNKINWFTRRCRGVYLLFSLPSQQCSLFCELIARWWLELRARTLSLTWKMFEFEGHLINNKRRECLYRLGFSSASGFSSGFRPILAFKWLCAQPKYEYHKSQQSPNIYSSSDEYRQSLPFPERKCIQNKSNTKQRSWFKCYTNISLEEILLLLDIRLFIAVLMNNGFVCI